MSRLETATHRLVQAVGRLEAAVEAEMSGLKEERERLTQGLKTTQADYAALQSVTRSVSSRLDAAIVRLKSLLEG
jgi:FtsZ-binding cell division protein ZapB